MRPVKIGILNVMHDKKATKDRFTHVLHEAQIPVDLSFYYPKTHYQNRPVPNEVTDMMAPLEIETVKSFDAFIITGAPIERIDYDDITYIAEIRELLAMLKASVPNLLFVCWGGMVAANYFFGIGKTTLNNGHKLFGVFPDKICAPDPLLNGLRDGFLAPHARYAELNHQDLKATPELIVTAKTIDDYLFSMRTRDGQQNYLFAHLEYDRYGLRDEYLRETQAYPERFYKLPVNDWSPNSEATPFAWQQTQQIYYRNWVKSVAQNLHE